ncbi:MAG: DUF5018 domain-containing protein [Tannerellaceae bacterium]|jgi:hypothetical protein|nr:DUF5018 domain-containing protein [Tannerellaceae bacterium]
MKKIYCIFIAVCCLALLAACNKDEDLAFSGRDNYITSFKLTLSDSRFTASIAGDQLIIHTIEGRDLNGATASVVLSEHAKIHPDPAGISDWNNNQTFVVTSYNGEQQIYQYTVIKEKAEAAKKGHFILTSQTEVDDFGTLGVEFLDGSLTLGIPYNYLEKPAPGDPIISLAPLASLQEIKGALTLDYGTPDDLSKFESLQKVGAIQITGMEAVKNFIFPVLEFVYGNISMGEGLGAGGSVRTVYLPKLKSVEGNVHMQWMGGINSFMMPNLESVLGYLFIGGNGGMEQLETLSLPMLKVIGGSLRFYQFTGKKLEVPVLRKCGGFDWDQSGHNVEKFEFPMLEELMGYSIFREMNGNTSTISISMPKVTYIEDLTLRGLGKLTKLEMPNLKRIKNLTLTGLGTLKNLNSFSSLETVEGTLALENLSALEYFELPASLTSLNTLSISNLPIVTELDLRGTGIKGVGVSSNSSIPFKLTADNILEGSLTLSGLFDLKGFNEIKGNVTITCAASDAANEQIPNTQKIGGNFSLSYTGKKGSVFTPALQEVGGSVTIKSDSPFKADNLTTIGGTLLYDITMNSLNGSIVYEFALPKLTSVGGDFIIYPWARPATVIIDIQMPALTKISGKLFIRHTDPGSAYGSSGVASNNITNLDGFSALTSVQSVEIWRQGALKSFKGLKNAVRSFSADSWNVKNCGYNPSYEDMLNGDTEGQ